MEERFVSSVSKALELVRKRDILTLGKQDLAYLPIVQQESAPAAAPVELGRTIAGLLDNLLNAKMRPEDPEDLDRVDWRRYIVLREYIFRGRTMGEVMADIGLREALFYQTKREAIEAIASHLWSVNQDAARAAEAIPQNILQSNYDFVPRLDENGNDLIEAILNGLKRRPWVVSIRGFGGVGKSTLAIEAAWAAVRRRMFDRVAWVKIEPEDALSPDLFDDVLDTIGKGIGARNVLTMEDAHEKGQTIVDALSQTKCLVVIDSTEDVEDDAYEPILALVRDFPMPTCSLLVSREKRRKTELETVIPLTGMREDEALEFIKARAREQSVKLDDQGAMHLFTTTCGNPRAMLFAIGFMGKREVSAQDVLGPETPEMPDLLDELLQRAYARLDSDEESVLNAMTLFANPVIWPPIAAAAGLSEDPARAKIALGNLRSRFLVDIASIDRHNSYSIAPLTRMFLSNKAQSREARIAGQPSKEFRAGAHERLIDHCIEEFGASAPYKRLNYVRSYRETVIRELEWCRDHGMHRELSDLFYYTGTAFGDLGYWRDRLIWGQEAVSAAEKDGRVERATWHKIWDLGWTYMQRGELDKAKAITDQALSALEPAHHPEAHCIAHRNLGVMALVDGDYDKALEHLEASLSLQDAQPTTEYSAMAKAALALVKLKLGDIDQAQRLFEEALQVNLSLDNPTFISMSLTGLATTSLARRDTKGAIKWLEQSLAIAKDIPDPSRARAYALRVRGSLHEDQGDLQMALECYEEALDIYSRLGQALRISETEQLIDALRRKLDSGSSQRG